MASHVVICTQGFCLRPQLGSPSNVGGAARNRDSSFPVRIVSLHELQFPRTLLSWFGGDRIKGGFPEGCHVGNRNGPRGLRLAADPPPPHFRGDPAMTAGDSPSALPPLAPQPATRKPDRQRKRLAYRTKGLPRALRAALGSRGEDVLGPLAFPHRPRSIVGPERTVPAWDRTESYPSLIDAAPATRRRLDLGARHGATPARDAVLPTAV